MNYLNEITNTAKFKLSPNALEIIGDIDNSEILNCFNELALLNQCTNWWLGDFLNQCEIRGKDLSSIGNIQTLKNIKVICSKVSNDSRVDGVSFSHHVDAYLECKKDPKIAKWWLEMSKKNNWSVAEQRKNIREAVSSIDSESNVDQEEDKPNALYSEAFRSINSITRLLNNDYNNLSNNQKADLKIELENLVTLIKKVVLK